MDLDLNIDNYSLQDILKLFKLNYNFDSNDVKQCYRLALKTHPDKCDLGVEYFHFFMKAYKIIEEIYKFRNKDQINSSSKLVNSANTNYGEMYANNDLDSYSLHGESTKETNEKILKCVKNKSRAEFNEWFNQLFNKVKIVDEEVDDGYEEWFRGNENKGDLSQEKLSNDQFSRQFEKHREKTKAMVRYEGVKELQSSGETANNGYGILRKKPESYSSSLFSKLNYEDLKKAHTETVVPVTQSDFENKEKFNNLNELKQYRNNQNVNAMSIEQSRQYLNRKKNTENEFNTNRAYDLIKQDQRIAESHKKWWSHIRQLGDK